MNKKNNISFIVSMKCKHYKLYYKIKITYTYYLYFYWYSSRNSVCVRLECYKRNLKDNLGFTLNPFTWSIGSHGLMLPTHFIKK